MMPVVSEDVREKLLEGAVAVLDRLEDYDEESAFAQVFDRLNQWSHAAVIAGATPVASWQIDPLFASVPDRLRAGTTPQSLGSAVFDAAGDMTILRDQRWLADIADSARGDAVEDLDIATNLFRWTVRSLAVVSDPPMVATDSAAGSRWFLPGEILLSGRASPAQRAWIFLELLRHAGLDGVMLATGDADRGGVRAGFPRSSRTEKPGSSSPPMASRLQDRMEPAWPPPGRRRPIPPFWADSHLPTVATRCRRQILPDCRCSWRPIPGASRGGCGPWMSSSKAHGA